MTFRCGSLSEFRNWTKAIKTLHEETEKRMKTADTGDLVRITEFYQHKGATNQAANKTNDVGLSSFR